MESTATGAHATGTFVHGVASGDPLQDRVIIWTRISGADGAADVAWTVARDPELGDVVASGTASAEPAADWTVHVDAVGLEPGTDYWYGFASGGISSPIGRTRTLPADGARHLRLAMASCAKFNAGFFTAYGRIAARDDLDFVLHLGDYIYEAAQDPPASQTPGADIDRPFEPRNECVTLADYRTRYAQYRRDPDVQAMHLRHPLIATLDDHEVADGAWREGSLEHTVERDGPWAARRDAAFQARWEWLPARMPDPDHPHRVFRDVHLGGLADLLLLDTRTRRDAPVGFEHIEDPGRTQLGPEQLAWFYDELGRSRSTWRLIGNSSVMSQMWSDRIDPDQRKPLSVVKLIGPKGDGPDVDQWDGYPVERRAILGHLATAGIRDVVILSGDVHVALALDMPRDPADSTSTPVAVEFVTPSLTSQNVDEKMHWQPRTGSLAVEQAMRAALPSMRFVDLDSHGYVTVDVNEERVRGDWWFVDTVLERTSGERLGASWSVRRGTPALVPADELEPKPA